MAADLAGEQARYAPLVADDAFGRVDTLGNAARPIPQGTLVHASPELFDALITVVVGAPSFLTQRAIAVGRAGLQPLLTPDEVPT